MSSSLPPAGVEPRKRSTPRRWRDKFREAGRGIKLGIRGHSSFSVHFFFAALAITAGVVLEIHYLEWCLVIGCIGAVLTAELFNSAVETLFHGLAAETRSRMVGCLDIAAGAVLLASVTAAIIGAIIFGRRLLGLWT